MVARVAIVSRDCEAGIERESNWQMRRLVAERTVKQIGNDVE